MIAGFVVAAASARAAGSTLLFTQGDSQVYGGTNAWIMDVAAKTPRQIVKGQVGRSYTMC